MSLTLLVVESRKAICCSQGRPTITLVHACVHNPASNLLEATVYVRTVLIPLADMRAKSSSTAAGEGN